MLRIRDIQTTTNGEGKTVPLLDADGREIENYCIEVPEHVVVDGPDAINAFVAEQLNPTPPAEGQELAP